MGDIKIYQIGMAVEEMKDEVEKIVNEVWNAKDAVLSTIPQQATQSLLAIIDKAQVEAVRAELFRVVDPGNGNIYSLERIGKNAKDRLASLGDR